MISSKGAGAANRLKVDYPHIIITHDICHAINLVLEHALESFPQEYIAGLSPLVKSITNSPLKTSQLRQAMLELGEDAHSIIKYVPTHWSSLDHCLRRIIILVEPLKLYLSKTNNQRMREWFNDKNITMLELLSCLIGHFDGYIIRFQKDNMDILLVCRLVKELTVLTAQQILDTDRMYKEYKIAAVSEQTQDELSYVDVVVSKVATTSQETLSRDYVRNTSSFIDYFHSNYHMQFKTLKKEDERFRMQFFTAAESFLKSAIWRIKSYLFGSSDNILLADCFSLKSSCSIGRLRELGGRFINTINPTRDLSTFNSQVGQLKLYHDEYKSIVNTNNTSNWLNAYKDRENELNKVYQLSRTVECFPYSSVNIERAFSHLKNVKNFPEESLPRRKH